MLVAKHCRSTPIEGISDHVPILMGHELRTDLWFELNDALFHFKQFFLYFIDF